jgi:hypothetical protein
MKSGAAFFSLKFINPASDNGFADRAFDKKGKRRVTIARKKGNATFFFMVARNSITLPIMYPHSVFPLVHMPGGSDPLIRARLDSWH